MTEDVESEFQKRMGAGNIHELRSMWLFLQGWRRWCWEIGETFPFKRMLTCD